MPHATLAKDAKEFYSRRAAEIVELSSHVPQLRDALSRAKVAKDANRILKNTWEWKALLRSVSASSLSFAGFTDSEVMKLMGGLRQHEPHTT